MQNFNLQQHNLQQQYLQALLQQQMQQPHQQQQPQVNPFMQNVNPQPLPNSLNSSVAIYSVKDEAEAERWQVSEGAVVLLCQADGMAVYVKRAVRNGITIESQMEVYKKHIDEPVSDFVMPDLGGSLDLSEVKQDLKMIKTILEDLTNVGYVPKGSSPVDEPLPKTNKRGGGNKQPSDENA